MGIRSKVAAWLSRELTASNRELAYWRGIVEGDLDKKVQLVSAKVDGNGVDLSLKSNYIGIVISAWMVQMLDVHDAKNYVSIEACHADKGPLEFLVQRRLGQTPARRNLELTMAVQALLDKVHRDHPGEALTCPHLQRLETLLAL